MSESVEGELVWLSEKAKCCSKRRREGALGRILGGECLLRPHLASRPRHPLHFSRQSAPPLPISGASRHQAATLITHNLLIVHRSGSSFIARVLKAKKKRVLSSSPRPVGKHTARPSSRSSLSLVDFILISGACLWACCGTVWYSTPVSLACGDPRHRNIRQAPHRRAQLTTGRSCCSCHTVQSEHERAERVLQGAAQRGVNISPALLLTQPCPLLFAELPMSKRS